MASIKPLTQADRRPLSGANRSREPIAFAAESDPFRHISRIICCGAQWCSNGARTLKVIETMTHASDHQAHSFFDRT